MQVSSGSERDSLTVEGDTLLKITADFECMCKEEKGTKVIYSVVLAYIGNALCRDSKSVVKRAALGCFTSEEIHDAKVELWSKSSASVIGSCPLRRGSQQRSRADFEVEDIIDAFESLDKEDCSTNVHLSAFELGRLPAVNLGRFLLLKSRLFEDIYGLYGKSKMAEQQVKMKEEKVRLALEKLKDANIKKVC
ncbi:hypothetical protein CAPTEDRAFT_194979 [Capitella teleta]|uniref:Uncharacterized protein n=1 Tax=Capitella teleta TaxID=283909 RepID=R7VLR7_CAPTE|nr:hypothetical protein CAPTEDRAFT_194979 [Capitella teleta]|eukprot:ELU17840.1 hypothetical protein CAPTEDRAFT_194979 [Capitella teleta]